jgi:D-alanyl-D-alanine carboxypeptidase
MKQRTILTIAFVMMLVITVVVVVFISSAFPNLQYLFRLIVPDATPTQAPTAIPTPTPTPSPTPAPFITGTAAYLIDADTGRVLYTLHSTQQLPIASTTKIMTAIVTIENAALIQSSVPATFQGVIGPGRVSDSMQAGARSSRYTTAPCR